MRKTPIMPDTPSFRQEQDGRLHAPAAARNFQPILAKLRKHAPESGRALEIASGTGQHIAALAAEFPGIEWHPSDLDEGRIASIGAWLKHANQPNLLPPIELDAVRWKNGPSGFDLITMVNLFHLVSSAEVKSILQNIRLALNPDGHAFVYGPFRDGETYRSDGDRTFDANLRAQDAEIGYESHQDVVTWAQKAGLSHVATYEMPANNLAIVMRFNP